MGVPITQIVNIRKIYSNNFDILSKLYLREIIKRDSLNNQTIPFEKISFLGVKGSFVFATGFAEIRASQEFSIWTTSFD